MRLNGNNSHTYADVNDDGRAQAHEEIPPLVRPPVELPAQAVPPEPTCRSATTRGRAPGTPTSLSPGGPTATRTGLRCSTSSTGGTTTCRTAPIGFTEDAGNFQRKNFTRQGKDGDAVNTQTDDGANTDHGLPDGAHIDNANMSTPPDGMAPVMQMYLQHEPGTSYPDGDPFSPTNVGDEADTVYHEYTHGLSNRLVVDAGRHLHRWAAARRARWVRRWGDWYAMDYLVSRKLQKDRPGIADLIMFQYDGEGVFLRPERAVGLQGRVRRRSAARAELTGHGGGYTYADYGDSQRRPGGPRRRRDLGADAVGPAATGWARTLAESLVTRAMELAPYNPSFLDMRNAILMADTGGLLERPPDADLEDLRPPGDGLLRRLAGRQRRLSGL